MLYLIYGDDRAGALRAWGKLTDKFRKDSGKVFEVDSETFEAGALDEFVDSQDLFGGKVLVLCRGLLGKAETRDWITDKSKRLAESNNHFALLEGKLLKTQVSKLGKKCEVEECMISASAKAKKQSEDKANFSKLFHITDALGRRDRKRVWVEYHKLLADGVSPEEVYWKLWWQSKNMLLATRASDADEADLKPFVYDKAKGAASNYSTNELVRLQGDLLETMYQINLRNKDSADIILERFIVSL